MASFLDDFLIWVFRFYKKNNASSATKPIVEQGSSLSPEEEIFTVDEIDVVIQRLGIACEEEESDGNGVEDCHIGVNAGAFAEMFVEEEPTLAEIEQVFQVFDVNKDGFIDAGELQRVFCGLSMREGYKLEKCERMICVFDGNGDGLLDFQDFLLLMEKCFSS